MLGSNISGGEMLGRCDHLKLNHPVWGNLESHFNRRIGSFAPETELLIHCLAIKSSKDIDDRIAQLLSDKIDLDYFLLIANHHGVLPFAQKTINKFKQIIPREWYDQFESSCRLSTLYNLSSMRALIEILDLLQRNDIQALPYKGPVAAKFIYGDISLRQFGDLDILVAKKDVLNAKRLLSTIGYLPINAKSDEQDKSFMDAGRPYNYKLLSGSGRVPVELHWRFTSKYNSFPIDYDRIMQELTSIEIAGRIIPNLKAEQMLVILCQHGSKHFWARLLWINDVATLIHRHRSIDWDLTIKFAESYGARRMLFLGIQLAVTLFGLEIPEDLAAKLRAERKVKSLSIEVAEQLFSDAEISIKRFSGHLFSIRMRERWRDKARYLTYHLKATLANTVINSIRVSTY